MGKDPERTGPLVTLDDLGECSSALIGELAEPCRVRRQALQQSGDYGSEDLLGETLECLVGAVGRESVVRQSPAQSPLKCLLAYASGIISHKVVDRARKNRKTVQLEDGFDVEAPDARIVAQLDTPILEREAPAEAAWSQSTSGTKRLTAERILRLEIKVAVNRSVEWFAKSIYAYRPFKEAIELARRDLQPIEQVVIDTALVQQFDGFELMNGPQLYYCLQKLDLERSWHGFMEDLSMLVWASIDHTIDRPRVGEPDARKFRRLSRAELLAFIRASAGLPLSVVAVQLKLAGPKDKAPAQLLSERYASQKPYRMGLARCVQAAGGLTAMVKGLIPAT